VIGQKLDPSARFIRTLRLTQLHCETLRRMRRGDYLKKYTSGKLMLHSSEPTARPSVKLTPATLNSLEQKGLVEWIRERDDRDGSVYLLTEDGETAAKILQRSDLPQWLGSPKAKKNRGTGINTQAALARKWQSGSNNKRPRRHF
jgi:DNA-binding PadR family transcriptional regulator